MSFMLLFSHSQNSHTCVRSYISLYMYSCNQYRVTQRLDTSICQKELVYLVANKLEFIQSLTLYYGFPCSTCMDTQLWPPGAYIDYFHDTVVCNVHQGNDRIHVYRCWLSITYWYCQSYHLAMKFAVLNFLFLCSAHDFTGKYHFFLILLFNVDLISSTSALIVAGKVVDGLLVMRKIEVQVPQLIVVVHT